ncbi:MAG: hypothetical protein ACRD3D_18245 [Terriglobia bacterium]
MKKILLCLFACVLAYGVAAGPVVSAGGPAPSLKLMKRQQKMQRRQLQIEQKMWKRSYRGQRIPRAERLAEKHQFQRNMRTLRLQQRNQIQQMKDEQRVMKYRRSHPLY